MQRGWDPYFLSCGVCCDALFAAILIPLGKFFFCTAGGWEKARSENIRWMG